MRHRCKRECAGSAIRNPAAFSTGLFVQPMPPREPADRSPKVVVAESDVRCARNPRPPPAPGWLPAVRRGSWLTVPPRPARRKASRVRGSPSLRSWRRWRSIQLPNRDCRPESRESPWACWPLNILLPSCRTDTLGVDLDQQHSSVVRPGHAVTILPGNGTRTELAPE